MRHQNYYFYTLYQNYTCYIFFNFLYWNDNYQLFLQDVVTYFSTVLKFIAIMKSKIVKVNGKRRGMYLLLWRICGYYLHAIDTLFVLRDCFHFFFAKMFSAQFSYFDMKVYFAKFQQKFAIHESLFLYFLQIFFLTKVSDHENFYP